ncbi:MAG: M20/M25/M40 family metallo-hydrolase, partial [Myxococcota bacterium]|nr:M20/M25/M40 family metallo-hydrolase [Myxococcota bacterium]
MLILTLACSMHVPMEAPPAPTPHQGAEQPVGFERTTPRRLVGSEWKDEVGVQILRQARSEGRAMEQLAWLCDWFPGRLAGTEALEGAVVWAAEMLEEVGATQVRLDPVEVPVWVRGEERLELIQPFSRELEILGLGGTVGVEGLEAPVVVVSHFDELGPQVEGAMVLYDVPMNSGTPTLERYGEAVAYRAHGASRAAEYGAAGVLVRSVTTRSLYTPHTGGLRYDENLPRIPAAAVTVEDSAMLKRLVGGDHSVVARLDLGAHEEPDATSHNVLGEIQGSEHPDEIVVIGAHLDSWDVTPGAHDDGAGVIQVLETMRIIADLPVEPRRTIRAVLFTNEENGLRGGRAYARDHGEERHIAAIESDLGGGWPLTWSARGTEEQVDWLASLAAPLGMP